ncbi:hypothetical protein AVEN_275209-1 [Araneus ventricosus]|uniref:RNase H type-1 domain-containing protein n=1 Tax=Araneus ventricosus TaxID=182803 RepID=A0A4Y2NNP2_ARAVE|nr:hypothetical protein AVEN_275209-1 [Araneus ventricosus]
MWPSSLGIFLPLRCLSPFDLLPSRSQKEYYLSRRKQKGYTINKKILTDILQKFDPSVRLRNIGKLYGGGIRMVAASHNDIGRRILIVKGIFEENGDKEVMNGFDFVVPNKRSLQLILYNVDKEVDQDQLKFGLLATNIFLADNTLKEAVELATQYPPSTSISIHVDNRASLQATSNPKTTSPTSRKIFNALLNNTNITLHWIKAHAGHEGNEKADQLAKEDSATGNMYDIQKLPKPYIKSILKNKMMQQWQLEWNKRDTGKKIRDILPKVSTHSANWFREQIIFFSEHGPFPAYRKRFGLHQSDLCGCGKVGTAMHYATECIFTESWHMTKPSQDNLQAWQKSVAANVHARSRIKHIISFIHSNLDLFKPP